MFVFFVSFFSWVFFVCLFLGMVGVTIRVRMICNLQPGLVLWKSVVNSGYWGKNIFYDKFLSCFFPWKIVLWQWEERIIICGPIISNWTLNIYHSSQEKARQTILILDKLDSRTKKTAKDKEEHHIMIRGSTHRKLITILKRERSQPL